MLHLPLYRAEETVKETYTDGELLKLLQKSGGRLPLDDNSSPEEIASLTGLSKKSFKKAVGALYRQRRISIGNGAIELSK